MEAAPYTGVACNVDVLKHVEKSKGGKNRRRRRNSSKSKVATQKVPIRDWKKFLLKDDYDEIDGSEIDPEYQPPANMYDSDDDDSNISEEEILDLAESLKIGRFHYLFGNFYRIRITSRLFKLFVSLDLKLDELFSKEGDALEIEKAMPKVDGIEVTLPPKIVELVSPSLKE